jgi:hypothetical protein
MKASPPGIPGDAGEIGPDHFNAFFTYRGLCLSLGRIAARIAAIGMPSFAS